MFGSELTLCRFVLMFTHTWAACIKKLTNQIVVKHVYLEKKKRKQKENKCKTLFPILLLVWTQLHVVQTKPDWTGGQRVKNPDKLIET